MSAKVYVYVVTGLELGWDCVVGVYDARFVTEKELHEAYPKDQYVVFERTLRTEVEQ